MWPRGFVFLVPYGSLRYFVCNFSRKFESSLSCFVFASLGVFALDYYYFLRVQLFLARLQVEIVLNRYKFEPQSIGLEGESFNFMEQPH